MTPTLDDNGMHYYRLAPDARLRKWIPCYWWVEPAPGWHGVPASAPDLLLPDGHSEIVFRFSGHFTRWHLGDVHTATRMSESYVIGGRSRSVLARSPGGLKLAGVKLDPRALRALLGQPLTEFRDVTVSCRDLGCRALLDLEDEIVNLRSPDGLAAVCDRFFLERLSADVRDDTATELLLDRLRATRGVQPILAWARENGLDARTLERRFVARMGVTPKQFARIERFKQSYARLCGLLSERDTLGRRAHLDAYYDDSHFDREFRHFMGTSPVAWISESSGFTTFIADHLLEGELVARAAARVT
jgi:AraC-like DNA-binding protein